MMIKVLIMITVVHVAQIIYGGGGNRPIQQRCNGTITCNCSYPKRYNKPLDITCFISPNNCSWYRKISDKLEYLTNASEITLPGNFDLNSYGTFTAKTFNDSCDYVVIPSGPCNNCSKIIIDGIGRRNNETLCKHISDDLIIEGIFPKVFDVRSFLVWVNGSSSLLPESCMCHLHTLTCDCSNLRADHSGNYAIHSSVRVWNSTVSREWLSNNVEIIVQIVTVAFEQAAYNVSENNTSAQITLILNKPWSANVTIEVFNTNVTAFGGVNYALGPYSVIFPTNHTHAPLLIAITNDVLLGHKMFNLTINTSSLPSHINVNNPFQVSVTIVDDDVATVRFEKEMYTYCINQIVQLALNLSSASSTDITLQVYTNITLNGGASYDVDGTYNVTFLANHANASFNIQINENIPERNKSFLLVINSSSLPSNVKVDEPSQASVDEYCNPTSSTEESNPTIAIILPVISALVLLVLIILILLYKYRQSIRKWCTDKKAEDSSKDSSKEVGKDNGKSTNAELNPELNAELNPELNPELNSELNPELNPELKPEPVTII